MRLWNRLLDCTGQEQQWLTESGEEGTTSRNPLVRLETFWTCRANMWHLVCARRRRMLHMKATFSTLLVCLVTVSAPAISAEPSRSRTSQAAPDSRDRVVCRRFLRTGSLVDSYRTCKTNREWQREQENIQHLSVSNSCRDPLGCDPG
jgi:hypothetical protein